MMPPAIRRLESSSKPGLWLISVAILLVTALGIGWVTSLALSIPKLSANLREVFWHGGNLLNLFCFGLFVEGLGAGSGLLGLALRRVQLPWLLLPLLALPVCLVAYLCLYLSITPETLHDFLGSSLAVQPLRSRELPATLAFLIPVAQHSPHLASTMELAIRFTALYAPLLLLTALFIAVSGDIATHSHGVVRNTLLALTCVLLLWLCRLVVVNFAATDNLVELLATSTPGGLSALTWIQMAIATIAAAAVGLWLAMIGLIPAWIAALLFLSAIPLAHGSLSLGLVGEAHKYGLSFEALNFLMTGRRDAAMAPAMSFALWAVAQSCLTLVIALGIRVVLPYRVIKKRDTRADHRKSV